MQASYLRGCTDARRKLGLTKIAAGRMGRVVSSVGRGLKYLVTPQLERLPQNAPPAPSPKAPVAEIPSATPPDGRIKRFVKGLPQRAWDNKMAVGSGAVFGLMDGETPEQRVANAAWQGSLGMFGWPGVVAGMAIPRIAGGKKE